MSDYLQYSNKIPYEQARKLIEEEDIKMKTGKDKDNTQLKEGIKPLQQQETTSFQSNQQKDEDIKQDPEEIEEEVSRSQKKRFPPGIPDKRLMLAFNLPAGWKKVR